MLNTISPSDVGVIIQGPIQSLGRVLTDLKFRQYDSTNDVKMMLRAINEIGATPMVVTWLDQNIEGFSAEERENIERIPFPKGTAWRSFRNDWNKNSKYRQYYSTLTGVLKLKERGCQYVIKVRTDNLVDLHKLVAFIATLNPTEVEKYFYTPLINLDKPHMFYDFYSFSSILNMERFCRVMIYEKERTNNIHFDVFYRWTKHQIGSQYSLSDIASIYPRYPVFTWPQLDLIRKGLAEVFRPLPKEIWSTLYWRGEQLGEQGLKDQYRFAETSAEEILNNFNSFNYKKSEKVNINYLSVPSFFVTSRVEVQLHKYSTRLSGAKHKLIQFTRKIRNR